MVIKSFKREIIDILGPAYYWKKDYLYKKSLRYSWWKLKWFKWRSEKIARMYEEWLLFIVDANAAYILGAKITDRPCTKIRLVVQEEWSGK